MTADLRVDAILATHNRADRLRDALRAHARMTQPAGCRYRLIVVDNNSTDDTRAVVESFAHDSAFECRYVFESRQGLSHARNAGLAHVDSDVVAYIDDDCYPEADWLTVLVENMTADNAPTLMGGSAFLFDDADLPITIVTDPVRKPQTVANLFNGIAGLNFCFDLSLLERIGNFDTCLGAGSAAKAGEDIDFVYRALKAGFAVEYVPTWKVYHHHGRQDPAVIDSLMAGYYIGRGAFYAKHLWRRDKAIVKMAYWEFRRLLSDVFSQRDKQSLRYITKLLTGMWIMGVCSSRRAMRRLS